MIDIIKQINHNILNNNFTEDIAWQSLKGQSLNVFNVREILEFHQRGHKVQNTVIQNANMNIGLASILREVLLKRTVNFVKRNLILSNHKTISTVLMNVLARPKVSMRKGFVLIAENLLKLRGLLQIFVVPGNVELLVREHLIGRHEQKNLRNVNNAEKNFGLDKIGLRSEKANSVLKNVFQNLNRFSMQLLQNSTTWQNGERFVLKFLNVMITGVRLVVLMVKDFMSTILNTNETAGMRI